MKRLPITDVSEHASCVARVPMFAGLSREDQRLVGSLATPVTLAPGETLARAGDAMGRLFVVHEGAVKLTHVAPSGRTRLVRVAQPGEALGERPFLTGERVPYTMEAVSWTQLCRFEHADLERLVTTYPAVAVGIMRALSRRLAEAERRLELTGVDVPARVASFLLDQPAERHGTDLVVRLPWPKKDVASWLGATPESFSRALSKLTAQGVIEVNGDLVTLRTPDALDDLAAG